MSNTKKRILKLLANYGDEDKARQERIMGFINEPFQEEFAL